MEPLFWAAIGASGVVGLILARLIAKHGLAWVEAKVKAKASAAENDLKTRIEASASDLESKIKTVLSRELDALKARLDKAGVAQ